VEQAAESLDVSLRTVQRERRYDQDFDHEVRLALQQSPDPLKLMEHAARTHWRAAAWLLERTKPEEFARKPVNMTSLKLVATAFRYIQEAALETVPAEFREALYRRTQAAIEQSFDCCFPMRGKWGEPKVKQLPFATPLADVQSSKVWGKNVGVFHDYDEEGNIVFPPPVDPAEVAARQARVAELKQRLAERRRQEALGPRPAERILSPKTTETTEFNATKSAATEIPFPSEPSADDILSPKTPATTTTAATTSSPADGDLELVIALVERTIDDECPETWHDTEELDHPDAQDPDIRLRLLSERLERHRRKERRQARAAERKAKAARKRAQAQRRRAA
ncbi:MAG: hypothetical protein JNL18_14205, partial [Planctomycetaceae bacterium]|nr:hypothetical protein [Planctomycetaceae bacterium]